FKQIPNPTRAMRDMDTLIPEIRYHLSTLPPDPEGKFSPQARLEVRELHASLTEKRNRARAAIGRIEDRIDHIRNAHHESCPSCAFKFIPGVGDKELEHLETRLKDGHTYLDKITKELEDLSEVQNAHAEYE